MNEERNSGVAMGDRRASHGPVRVEIRTTKSDATSDDGTEAGSAGTEERTVPQQAETPAARAPGPGTEGPPAPPEPEPVAPPDRDVALARERDELRDRLLRTAAEFDNYRKRVERERREKAEWAAANLLEAMLPIVDDLERALDADATADPEGFHKGVELIHRQLLELLARHGVAPIEAVGTDFDPRLHEAILHEESDAHRPGEVMAEFRRGYKLGDRLLRASMVKVARP